MPAITVLVKVQIFTPFNQVVDFIFKVLIFQLFELVVIKGILIKRLELLLESG